ncbi:MAG: alkaline phosphatase family protein [Pseudomonadota bacterium]
MVKQLLLCAAFGALPAAAATPAPKLVLVLVVDGLPNEQVQRYREQFGPGGLRRLLDEGAAFSQAHQAHGVTVTAVGHAAILSGAYPYRHGVIGNNWIDPASHASVYCTEDARYHYLDEKTAAHDGTSPATLRVDTLGDQLRYGSGQRAKVVAVSGKDRGAILLAGKSGTAYMYMNSSGNFATSSYYMASYPQWVQDFRAARPQERFAGKSWTALLPPAAYAGDAAARAGSAEHFPYTYGSARDAGYYEGLKAGPFVDELTLDFARAAIDGEQLGHNPAGVPDLLAVSLSDHDYINHDFGPESALSHDHLLRLDRLLAQFFGFLEQRVGIDNVLVVLTADHGFSNTAEFSQAAHIDARRIDSSRMLAAVNAGLAARFKADKLVQAWSLPNLHLDKVQIDKLGLRYADVEAEAARLLAEHPGIAQVYTRSALSSGALPATQMSKLMQRAWHRQLSGDLMVVAEPYSYFASKADGTTHGSPYAYDTNVPLLLMGKRWIKPGAYGQYAEVVDIAPTLAHLLHLRPPAGAEGRVLTEALE